MTKPIIPILTLHGSGKRLLMAGYVGQIGALQDAIVAMSEASPHGRDYPDTETWRAAVEQHKARLAKLTGIIAELTEMAEAIR
jgi:hypothetical protein